MRSTRRVVAATLVGLAAGLGTQAAAPARAASVAVLNGGTYRAAIFPNDQLTVPDSTMLTGRRVNFRLGVDYPACDASNYSICDGFLMLNRLDGFDIQPRVTIPFSGAIDINSVTPTTVFIQGPGGRTQLMQLVWDPASNTLNGIANAMLYEASRYVIVVTSGVKDAAGQPVDACGGACVIPFTTMSASAELIYIRKTLDSGSAYSAAGITDRHLSFTQDGTADVFMASTIQPSIAAPATGILRHNQAAVSPGDPHFMTDEVVPNLIPPGFSGYFAFGSFMSPRYQYASSSAHVDDPGGYTDGVIPQVPTKTTPQPFGADRLGAILIVPPGPPPAGGWPVAIYGAGFTRSKFDIFVTADYNAALGVATIATDPAGHGYGPMSTVTVSTAAGNTTFKSYGRARDLDGDGCLADGLKDGVGPTTHITATGNCAGLHVVSELPSRRSVDGLRSGLIQTVVDNMALLRSIQAGVDVPGVGNDVLSHSSIYYYGLSFGSIYGTMLMGTDNKLSVGLLNVGGGPIADIARISGFRGDLANVLRTTKPNLLNGGPGLNGFTESIPLRQDPPVTAPVPGAMLIQETLATSNWFSRAGSPETFAPLLRLRKPADQPVKKLLFQTAYGDATVPNPTAGTMYRAGDLFDLVTYFRHDKSAPGLNQSDPHGWLANPTIDPLARTAGEQQLGIWLASGGTIRANTNPLLLEVPIAQIGNLDCLHYPEPQTGQAYSAPAWPTDSRECPTLSQDENGGWLPPAILPPESPSGGQLSGPRQLPNTAAASPWAAVLLLAAAAALAARRRRQPNR